MTVRMRACGTERGKREERQHNAGGKKVDPHGTTEECRTIDWGLVEGCIGLAHKQVVTLTASGGSTL